MLTIVSILAVVRVGEILDAVRYSRHRNFYQRHYRCRKGEWDCCHSKDSLPEGNVEIIAVVRYLAVVGFSLS